MNLFLVIFNEENGVDTQQVVQSGRISNQVFIQLLMWDSF